MRKSLLIIAVLFSLALSVWAQDIELPNSITTEDGLRISYPQGWFASEQGGAIVITGINGEFGGFNQNISQESGTTTALDAIEYLIEQSAGQDIGDIQTVDFDGRQGYYFISQGLPNIEDGSNIQLVFPVEDGTIIAGALVIFDAANVSTLQETLFAIAASATYVMPVEPDGGIGDGAAAPGTMTSDARILSDEMPPEVTTFEDGVLTMRSGVRVVVPERFTLPIGVDVTEYDTVALLYDLDIASTLTIMDDNSLALNDVINIMVPMMAMMAADEDYTQDDLETVTLEDGLEVSVYNSLISAPDADGFAVIMYIVPITPERVITVQLQGTPETIEDVDSLQADVLSVVESLQVLGVQAVTDAEGNVSVATQATCSDDGQSYVDSSTTSAVVECPAGCGDGGYGIWGTDIYTNDSSLCAAAIHAGIITNDEGGLIEVTYLEGQASYSGSERNGISTSDYGAWEDSFSVNAASE